MAALLHQELRRQGVRLALGDGLARIEKGQTKRLRVVLQSGRTTETDMVILAIGVRPESDLARDAGLELGPKGHILVNEYMQTSDPDIYAIGDAVQVINPILGVPTAVPLAGPASRQGRIAASHITGLEMPYRGTIGTAIVKVFDLTAACTGTNRHTLERAGVPFRCTITHSQDHVTYYPGATPMVIKLLYRPDDGRLLGAQVIGQNGVARTINTLATAISAGMTVFDLEHLELAYAPPYGAARDPVNIAGYAAGNDLRGDALFVEWSEIREPDGVGVLDVRTKAEWDLGHYEGAVRITHTELREHLDELDKDREWVVYCAIGRRGYIAERILRQNGFRVRNLSGGWKIYDAATQKQDNWDTWQPKPKEPAMEAEMSAVAVQDSPGDVV